MKTSFIFAVIGIFASHNDFTEELTDYIIGGNSAAYIVAAFFFVLLGALINVLYDIQTRTGSDDDAPDTWDCRYFLCNNRLRIALNLLMAMVVIRFFTDFTGHPLTLGYCFLIGIVFDAMFVVYRKLRKRTLDILEKFNP